MSSYLDQPLMPDPVIEAYKKDVDRTLLRENLKLTVEQRLNNLMALQEFAEELRSAGKRMRSAVGPFRRNGPRAGRTISIRRKRRLHAEAPPAPIAWH